MSTRTTLLADPAAEHQVVFRMHGQGIAVSCTCLRIATGGRPRYEPIDARPELPAAIALALWWRWHEAKGARP